MSLENFPESVSQVAWLPAIFVFPTICQLRVGIHGRCHTLSAALASDLESRLHFNPRFQHCLYLTSGTSSRTLVCLKYYLPRHPVYKLMASKKARVALHHDHDPHPPVTMMAFNP